MKLATALFFAFPVSSSGEYRDIDSFCQAGATLVTRFMREAFYRYTEGNVAFKSVIDNCRRDSGAKVYAGIKPTRNIKRMQELVLGNTYWGYNYDGMNLDIQDVKTEGAMGRLLSGWGAERKLALTMDAAQWDVLGPYINQHEILFEKLFFRTQDPAALEVLVAKQSFVAPRVKVFVLFNQLQHVPASLAQIAPWIQGHVVCLPMFPGAEACRAIPEKRQ